MNIPKLQSDTGSGPDAAADFSSSKEFEDFVYLISHDVRNSVRALIELPQWIEEDLVEAGFRVEGPIAQNIELMNRHTGRLDRMLVDLLAFSRVGRMQEVVAVDLGEALNEVLDEVSIPGSFEITSAFDCSHIHVGERDILTLLTALVSNAAKHHDREAGKITVSAHGEGTVTVLSVQDDGPGIPENFHRQVFDAMTTLKPRDEVEGSGMGLAIARKIAHLYGGSISILSDATERGTTVKVVFPGVRSGT
ncbi:HAMP domain-containing sensor histidine kinase [uncultured Roseobacter sp.]|uniref:sensor histidine kinase n=1 Tax=uncultured Roseobacter sp. TaxID=114847 RepID=UPI00262AE053|nr:HAMP domain-containing sensor histidine kinase [uncultured Roseobacter sp.]